MDVKRLVASILKSSFPSIPSRAASDDAGFAKRLERPERLRQRGGGLAPHTPDAQREQEPPQRDASRLDVVQRVEKLRGGPFQRSRARAGGVQPTRGNRAPKPPRRAPQSPPRRRDRTAL
jgi:hypothetical protein